jgi:L-fucose isomerase-like protein
MPTFKADLAKFTAVCRTVKGLRKARFGAIGARPGAFNTVRYSEKILEASGISVTTMDLSEFIGKANKLDGGDARVKRNSRQSRIMPRPKASRTTRCLR